MQCAPYWQRLQTELLSAAADPLYGLRQVAQLPDDDGPSLLDRIMHALPDEIRPILEWSLKHPDDLTSVFLRPVSQDRAKYLIGMLAP